MLTSSRFKLIDKEILKVYEGITNVILRISAKGRVKNMEKDAILLGAHMDSTLAAPGASE